MTKDAETNPNSSYRVGGVVLCGGTGRRMGADKASMMIGGRSALERVCRAVSHAVDICIVASRADQSLPPLPRQEDNGCPIFSVPIFNVVDPIADRGPLGGLLGGFQFLQSVGCSTAIVAACDHPLLRAEVVQRLVKESPNSRCVVTRHENRVLPLLARYRVEFLPEIDSRIRNDQLRMMDFVDWCNPHFLDSQSLLDVDTDLRSFHNINNPADLDAIQSLAEDE